MPNPGPRSAAFQATQMLARSILMVLALVARLHSEPAERERLFVAPGVGLSTVDGDTRLGLSLEVGLRLGSAPLWGRLIGSRGEADFEVPADQNRAGSFWE